MRSVSHPVGVSIASVIGAVCLLFVGLVAGWYLGRAKDGANLSLAGFVRQQGQAEATDAKGGGESAVPVTDVLVVNGQVQYLDSSGQLVPDSSATVILLPRQRTGSVLLNARSLQQSVNHPDRRATQAALAEYGGALGTADDSGHFRMTASAHKELVAIAVSRK